MTFATAKNEWIKLIRKNWLYLRLPKIGAIKIRMHRKLPAGCKLKQVSVTRKADGWYIQMMLEDDTVPKFNPDEVVPTWDNSIGLDACLHEDVYLATSEGEKLLSLKPLRNNQAKLYRISTKRNKRKRGSRSRRKLAKREAKQHQRIARSRKDFQYGLATLMNDAGVFAVLSQDSSQFVQNFLTVSGLLFSILVGQTYYFMYQQQESIYLALFNEVTEAKSLLEQVALVCQGRGMYPQVLTSISQYVENDLKKLQDDPAMLLSARPVDDPLESIMYMTSVGIPSSVYETVRSLRQARAGRLGALQRKIPQVHMVLLWLLALIELMSFPLLGAGTQTIGGYNILTVEGVLFGVMTFGVVMTLRVSIRTCEDRVWHSNLV